MIWLHCAPQLGGAAFLKDAPAWKLLSLSLFKLLNCVQSICDPKQTAEKKIQESGIQRRRWKRLKSGFFYLFVSLSSSVFPFSLQPLTSWSRQAIIPDFAVNALVPAAGPVGERCARSSAGLITVFFLFFKSTPRAQLAGTRLATAGGVAPSAAAAVRTSWRNQSYVRAEKLREWCHASGPPSLATR